LREGGAAEWRAREKGRAAASYLSYSSCLDRRLAMKKESRNVLIVVAVFVLSIALISLIDSLVIVYYAHLMGSTLEDASIATTKTVLIVNELLLGSLAVFFFTKIFKRRLVELGITTTRFARNIVIGLLLGAGGWLVAVIVATLLQRLIPFEVPEWFAKMLTATSSPDLLYFVLITWILVGPCEELFFRGFVQETFTAWKGPFAGIMAGAILFGLAHFSPLLWFRTIPSALLGLIYGIAYAKRRSLVPVSVAHSLNDTIGFVLAYLAK